MESRTWTRPRRWVSACAGGAGLLIVLGGVVSATESGLGCGEDWPLCAGALWPDPGNLAALIEYAHRAVAGFVGLLTLAGAFFSRGTPAGPWMRGAAALVIGQSLVGAWTVRVGLSPVLSTVHLALAELFFAVLVTAWASLAVPSSGWASSLRRAGEPGSLLRGAALLAAYATVVVGGYVKLSGAGLACGFTFPLCQGSLIPDFSVRHGHLVLAHWLHRLGALTVLALAGVLVWRARRAGSASLWSYAVGGLTLLQVALGVATVWSRLAPVLSVLHLANATALLGLLAWGWASARRPAGQAVPAPTAWVKAAAEGMRP